MATVDSALGLAPAQPLTMYVQYMGEELNLTPREQPTTPSAEPRGQYKVNIVKSEERWTNSVRPYPDDWTGNLL